MAEPLEEKGESRWDILKPKIIGDGKTAYLERVTIILTPLFSILFHRINRPDNQRELHDHPWSFFSIVLRGWYGENVPRPNGGQRYVKRKWWNFKRAEDRHSIRFVSRKPVVTLVFTGPRRRKWGFWVPADCDCGMEDNENPSRHRAFCSRFGVLTPASDRTKFVPWDEYERLNNA